MNKYQICDFSKTYAREPVLAIMPDGSLVCILTTGGPTEPHNENYTMICRSEDGGKTWSEPQMLFDNEKRGVWVTELFTEGDIPMMVVHTYNAEVPYKELQTFVSYTYDNGKTWTDPVSMAPHSTGFSIRKGFTLSNGDYFFPVYFTRIDSNFGVYKDWQDKDYWKGSYHSCAALISSDKGKTYTPYGLFEKNLWEPNAVELEDGHILMFMRDSNKPFMNIAESFDYGRTWEHKGNTSMPNANAKNDVAKVAGKVVLTSNLKESLPFDERANLVIQISDDKCKTWREPIPVTTPDEHIFYPHSAVDYDKKIFYLAYENARQFYINVYTFDELGL